MSPKLLQLPKIFLTVLNDRPGFSNQFCSINSAFIPSSIAVNSFVPVRNRYNKTITLHKQTENQLHNKASVYKCQYHLLKLYNKAEQGTENLINAN